MHSRTEENRRRLLDLASDGHLLLMTRTGPLDLLGRVAGGRDFAPHSHSVDIGDGLSVRILDLETLIELKEATGREKDRAQLPLLRSTLEERRRQGLDR